MTLKYVFLLVAFWVAGFSPSLAQTPEIEERLFVVLSPAEAERPGAEEMQRLQAGHLANIRAMAEAGILLLAGPTRPLAVESTPAAGILVFASADPEMIAQAESMLAGDPLISAGLLRADQYVLFFESGDNLYERRAREQN